MRSKGFALIAVAALAVVTTATTVDAQEHVALPPVNLGGSSFMDAIGGPGLWVRQATEVYEAQRFVGSNGADIYLAPIRSWPISRCSEATGAGRCSFPSCMPA